MFSTNTDRAWLYYDCGHVTGEDANAVWAGYAAVYHLAETMSDEATGGVHGDSTSYANQGEQNGNDDTSGRLAGGQLFDGNDCIETNTSTSLEITGALTLEAWVRIDGETGSFMHVLSKYDTGADRRSYGIYLENRRPHFLVSNDGQSFAHQVDSGITVDTGDWTYVAGTFDGTSGAAALNIYLDGQWRDSYAGPSPAQIYSSPASLTVACNLDDGSFEQWLEGAVDEARVTNQVRPADWIAAQFLSMSDNFILYGTPESKP